MYTQTQLTIVRETSTRRKYTVRNLETIDFSSPVPTAASSPPSLYINVHVNKFGSIQTV
jgi:hypothetical protein